MHTTIFDLEYTTWSNARARNWSPVGYHREVIQTAAIRFSKGQPWETAAKQMYFVRPVHNPLLSDFAKQLTGITQEQIDTLGIPAHVAALELSRFRQDSRMWSNGQDCNVWAETAGHQGFVLPFNTRTDCDNLRDPLHEAMEKECGEIDWSQYQSGNVYKLLGIQLPTDAAHNALHDVISLAATVNELIRRGHNFDFLFKAYPPPA